HSWARRRWSAAFGTGCPETGRLCHGADRSERAMGRPGRLPAARGAHHRGRAPLRARRPGGGRAGAVARLEPADLRGDGEDDREVRRGRRTAARGRGRVPDAGRVRVDQRRGAGTRGGGGGPSSNAVFFSPVVLTLFRLG